MLLKTLSKYNYRYFLIALAMTLFILIRENYMYLILLIPFSLYILKLHRDLIPIIIAVLSIYGLRLVLFEVIRVPMSNVLEVKVLHSIKHKEKTSFIGRVNGQPVMIYLDTIDTSIVPGDYIEITGEISTPINSTIPNTFSYKNYLKSKNIKYTMYGKSYEITNHSLSIGILNHQINNYITNYIPLTGEYVKTFILADKSDFDPEFLSKINYLGISHLFAVSGLHVGILVLVLDKTYKKVSPNKGESYVVIIPLLLLYCFLTTFAPSIIRATLMYVGFTIITKYKLNISSLDLLSFIYIFFLYLQPYSYYNSGFSLSFLVTFFILLGTYLTKRKTTVIQVLIITTLAFLATLPIVLSLNKQINLYTLIVNVLFVFYMTYIILPGGYFTFIFHFLDRLYYHLIQPFEYIIILVSKVTIFTFNFMFISPMQIMIYYFLIFFTLQKNHSSKIYKLNILMFILFIFVSININKFSPVKSVNMIDLYGDSILIIDSFDRCNILVDTGEIDAYDKVIQYIKSKNIKRIDYFITTHEHDDHMGERNDINDSFKVINNITNANSKYYSKETCGSIDLEFYTFQKTYQETNNQSIVFSLFINDVHYLFTGDMESKKEEDFIKLVDIDVDVLKSGHHGSITSSSPKFLEAIKAEEVMISCYRNNLHGHPHDEIINRYEEANMEIYRTDELGTIEINYIFGYVYKKYHKP